MKKLLCLLLALVMVASVSVATMAEDEANESAGIIIDGVKDDIYTDDMMISNDYWSTWINNTASYPSVADERGEDRIVNTCWFYWDDEFLYLYYECQYKFDDEHLVKPAEGQKRGEFTGWYEAASLWLDTAPSLPTDDALCQSKPGELCVGGGHLNCNCNSGSGKYYRLQTRYAPGWDEWYNYYRADEGMFLNFEQFTEKRGNEAGYKDNLEAMYMEENGAAEAAGIADYETDTYGFELKYPIHEGEEYFRMNITVGAPEYEWEEEGPELPYTIAFGPAWWLNFDSMYSIYYADYADQKVDKEVRELIAKIRQIPDISIVGLGHEEYINECLTEYEALTNTQKEQVGDDVIALVTNALRRIAALKVATRLGMLDEGDEIDASDALTVLKAAVNKVELTEQQKVLADVTGDGEIDATDALDILKFAVKKLDKFAAYDILLADAQNPVTPTNVPA